MHVVQRQAHQQQQFGGFWKATGAFLTGLIVGILAPILVRLGTPGNMGICVASFTRDIAGALGLHRAGSGSALRFLYGMMAAVGALEHAGVQRMG